MKKQNNHSRSYRWILPVLGLAASGGLFALSYATADTVLPGVAIEGVSVSGLRKETATLRVKAVVGQQAYTLTYGSQVWTASAARLGVTHDIPTAVDSALRKGRNVSSLAGKKDVAISVSVNAKTIATYLQKIGDGLLIPPVNAAVTDDDGHFVVRAEQAGTAFDVRDAVVQLQAGAVNLALKVAVVPAVVTASEVEPLLMAAETLAIRPVSLVIDGKKVEVPQPEVRSWFDVAAEPEPQLSLQRERVSDYLEKASQPMAEAPAPQQVLQGTQRTEIFADGKPGKQLALASAVRTVTDAVLAGTSGPIALALTEIPRSIQYLDPPVAPLPTGKVIGVDITKLHAYLYENGQLVYSMKVSTGINDWTPTGTFHVYAKTKKQKMSGPGYYIPNVPNILWFKGDYSMHGVYWHKDFGIRPRSHGCVGQSVPDSEVTYNFAEVGTPIVIYKS